VFCAGRFILGFGNSLAQLASPMLLTEIVHPQHRAPFTTIYNCLWNLGAFCKESFPHDCLTAVLTDRY
jgi:MFS family permease